MGGFVETSSWCIFNRHPNEKFLIVNLPQLTTHCPYGIFSHPNHQSFLFWVPGNTKYPDGWKVAKNIFILNDCRLGPFFLLLSQDTPTPPEAVLHFHPLYRDSPIFIIIILYSRDSSVNSSKTMFALSQPPYHIYIMLYYTKIF